jgi:chromosome partitioning protein
MMSNVREHTISDVAQLLGVTRKWVETRENKGLLPTPRRTPGGHRTYSTDELHNIRELAKAQGLKIPNEERTVEKSPVLPSGIIAILNQKGGVGKTTITQNLGVALAQKGLRILLVDLDKQYNLSTSFNVNIGEEERGLGFLFYQITRGEDIAGTVKSHIVETGYGHLHLLPNNLRMFDAEINMLMRPNREQILYRVLAEVIDSYDIVLIDCPPDLGVLTHNAIKTATGVVIPVDGDFSMMGMTQLTRILKEVSGTGGTVPILGVVVNRFDNRTSIHSYLSEKLEVNFPNLLFETQISNAAAVMESHVEKRPLLSYAPSHRVSRQFTSLADETLNRMRERGVSGGIA